jgi:thioredoxin-like negative regulator of GroEL
MKAFIGHSFDDKDKVLIDSIQKFIESTGIECVTGEKAQNSSIAHKVKERIKDCEIFVGIFTRDKLICPHTPSKWFCNPKKRNDQYTTSNWVLQESGYAIGINRELILLIENGIDDIPELQGDMEVIYFDRSLITEKYTIINQMVESIRKRTSAGIATKPIEESKQVDVHESKEHKEQPKEETKNKELGKIYKRITGALYVQNDYKEAQNIFNNELEPLLEPKEIPSWKAYILNRSQSLGDNDAFGKLQKLAKEFNDDPEVIKQLAYRYMEMREYTKASETFLLTVSKYNISESEQMRRQIDSYIQASWCLSYNKDIDGALLILRKLLSDNNYKEFRASIFKAMAEISKETNDIDRYIIYAEASLDIDPSDTNLRFNLAYVYSNNSDNQLAFLHYRKLIDTSIDSVALNNLGVQYDTLNMPSKCIKSYYKSTEYKETLAMANLAQKYIDKGFAEQARELIDKANKLSNEGIKVDYRVGNAQKRLIDMIEEDDKKEKEILAISEEQRNYRVKYSYAYCSDKAINETEIIGIWKTPWGNMCLNYDKETGFFKIEHSMRVEVNRYLSALLGGVEKDTKSYEDRIISIKGKIVNLSGKYTIEVSNEKVTTILTSGNIYKANGYMLINEKCDFIKIMEKTNEGKTKFEQWEKLPALTVDAIT